MTEAPTKSPPVAPTTEGRESPLMKPSILPYAKICESGNPTKCCPRISLRRLKARRSPLRRDARLTGIQRPKTARRGTERVSDRRGGWCRASRGRALLKQRGNSES